MSCELVLFRIRWVWFSFVCLFFFLSNAGLLPIADALVPAGHDLHVPDHGPSGPDRSPVLPDVPHRPAGRAHRGPGRRLQRIADHLRRSRRQSGHRHQVLLRHLLAAARAQRLCLHRQRHLHPFHQVLFSLFWLGKQYLVLPSFNWFYLVTRSLTEIIG